MCLKLVSNTSKERPSREILALAWGQLQNLGSQSESKSGAVKYPRNIGTCSVKNSSKILSFLLRGEVSLPCRNLLSSQVPKKVKAMVSLCTYVAEK